MDNPTPIRILVLITVLCGGGAAASEFELGIGIGTARLEQALTGTEASFEPLLAVVGRTSINPRISLFSDLSATATETTRRGEADLLVWRAGVDIDLRPRRPGGWTASIAAGYTWIGFAHGDDYRNAVYSLGLGQRFVREWGAFFWQARADITVSRSSWHKTLNDGKLLAGCTWKLPLS